MIKLKKLMYEMAYGVNMRIHMSKNKKDINKLKSQKYTQSTTLKPRGFWYGFGNSWINWVGVNMPEWSGNYIYKVNVDRAKLLKIKNLRQFVQFNKKYGVKLKISLSTLKHYSQIDWVKVSTEYDGIEINMNSNDSNNARMYLWYSTWDVASGCVWNLQSVFLELLSTTGPKI